MNISIDSFDKLMRIQDGHTLYFRGDKVIATTPKNQIVEWFCWNLLGWKSYSDNTFLRVRKIADLLQNHDVLELSSRPDLKDKIIKISGNEDYFRQIQYLVEPKLFVKETREALNGNGEEALTKSLDASHNKCIISSSNPYPFCGKKNDFLMDILGKYRCLFTESFVDSLVTAYNQASFDTVVITGGVEDDIVREIQHLEIAYPDLNHSLVSVDDIKRTNGQTEEEISEGKIIEKIKGKIISVLKNNSKEYDGQIVPTDEIAYLLLLLSGNLQTEINTLLSVLHSGDPFVREEGLVIKVGKSEEFFEGSADGSEIKHKKIYSVKFEKFGETEMEVISEYKIELEAVIPEFNPNGLNLLPIYRHKVISEENTTQIKSLSLVKAFFDKINQKNEVEKERRAGLYEQAASGADSSAVVPIGAPQLSRSGSEEILNATGVGFKVDSPSPAVTAETRDEEITDIDSLVTDRTSANSDEETDKVPPKKGSRDDFGLQYGSGDSLTSSSPIHFLDSGKQRLYSNDDSLSGYALPFSEVIFKRNELAKK